jgi:hypothetical protein
MPLSTLGEPRDRLAAALANKGAVQFGASFSRRSQPRRSIVCENRGAFASYLLTPWSQ